MLPELPWDADGIHIRLVELAMGEKKNGSFNVG
jgi:hypothetical protein